VSDSRSEQYKLNFVVKLFQKNENSVPLIDNVEQMASNHPRVLRNQTETPDIYDWLSKNLPFAKKKKLEETVPKVRRIAKTVKNAVVTHFEILTPLESWEPQLSNGIFIISR